LEYILKRAKKLIRHYKKASRSREAHIGITLGLVVSLMAVGYFILFHALVIEVGDKIVLTSPKKQQQLTSQSSTSSTATTGSSKKPFGVALSGTLYSLDGSQLNDELNTLRGMGVSWIRIDVAWAGVQPDSSTQYNWSKVDTVVSAANSHHLKVLATLAYTPAWAAVSGCDDSQQKCAPASDAQFATFSAAAAKRYQNRGIDAWEIWNEPNDQGFWMPAPDPVAYTALLATSYRAIKKVDPSSTVLSGGLAPVDSFPGSINPVTFLTDMYAAGANKYFDAVAYHPYSYPNLPTTVAAWSGWSMMNDLPTSIRSVMTNGGDANKKIWITEYGAPTGGPGQTETSANYGTVGSGSNVDDQLQAEMLTDSAEQYENYDWLGNYFWYSYKDLGASTTTSENFFGLYNLDGSPKPAVAAFTQAIQASK
jgi:hypothetical protein